jgi:hypothetical protein
MSWIRNTARKTVFCCSEEIGVSELQRALPPNMMSKLLERRQMEEVSSAGLIFSYGTLLVSHFDSVADPGSGIGCFLTPGSGIRNRFFPDPGSQDHIFKSFLTIFVVKSAIIL